MKLIKPEDLKADKKWLNIVTNALKVEYFYVFFNFRRRGALSINHFLSAAQGCCNKMQAVCTFQHSVQTEQSGFFLAHS